MNLQEQYLQLKTKSLLELEHLIKINNLNTTPENYIKTLSQYFLLKQALLEPIAIRTSNEKIRELIRNINRILLPLNHNLIVDKEKTSRKKFTFTINKKLVQIECLYKRATTKLIKYLLDNQCLVITQNNSILLQDIEQYIEKYNYYFIRRRSKEGRWYLMIKIELE